MTRLSAKRPIRRASATMPLNWTFLATVTAVVCSLMAASIISAASSSPNQTSSSSSSQANNQTASKTSPASASTSTSSSQSKLAADTAKAKGAEQQQQQPTDISSMYVQIPIAETADTGVPDGVQQTLSSPPDSDASASASPQAGSADSSKWSGPWPKKFQIGYIKQSDLHQVLIESLKGDPFVSIAKGTGSTPTGQSPAKSSSAPAPSTSSSGGEQKTAGYAAQSPQIPKQMAHMMPFGKNIYHQQPRQHMLHHNNHQSSNNNHHHNHNQFASQMHNFRDSKHILQPPHSFGAGGAMLPRHPQNSAQLISFQQHRISAPNGQQRNKYPPLMSMTGNNFQQQHPQLHFAGFPFSANQPIYTTDQQQQQQQQPMIVVTSGAGQSYGGMSGSVGSSAGRVGSPKTSPNYYATSWRPVPTNGENEQQQQQQKPSSFIDDDTEDDGSFNTPTPNAAGKDGGGGGASPMNRHPVLNNYLSDGRQVVSPATRMKQMSGATKSLASKTSATGTKSTKQATKSTDSSDLAAANRRRASNTTDTSSSTTTTSTTTTPSAIELESNTTATATAASATTTTASPTTTISNSEETETQDPDSVSINGGGDSDITDPSIEQQAGGSGSGQSATTTPATSSTAATTAADGNQQESSTQASSSTSSTTSVSGADVNQQTTDSSTSSVDAAEVATQSIGRANPSSLPSVGSAEESTTTTTTTTGSSRNREETTPSSTTDGQNTMEAAMTDEALLAASARNASDISKTSSRQSKVASQSTAPASKTKVAKERLVQSAQGRKTAAASQVNPKFTSPAKKATTVAPASRTAKQARAAPNQKSAATKSAAATKTSQKAQKQQSAKSAAKKSTSKATRMASAEKSQRLQQQPALVSMTAAQAQSTAQTLASLLLSRCMSSSNCAHLLDVCSTKQAVIPLAPTADESSNGGDSSTNRSSGALAAAWSMPVGLMSTNLNSLTQALQADRVLRTFPQWRETIEAIVDQETQSGYTLILPSNEAIDRLPVAQIDQWLSSPELMSQLIDNHIIDSSETIQINGPSTSSSQKQPATRMIRSKGLQVNQHRDRMVTINGKRLVYANQAAPAGGRIHVIDGVLDWPLSVGISLATTTTAGTTSGPAKQETKQLMDIMDTLKQCDKFDGFVTLAEGTGLTQILKQDGPMTVFVPSNEALRKIPDEELEVIKNNSTALKEFLMYHVVNGSYFSQDLRDGQQLASILDMKPIQVGVRVDGCSRRLVEANTSPMRRPDIVAKNGVIHILDWYLTVRDNDWCDSLTRPVTINAGSSSNTGPTAGSQQQQTGAETNRAALPSVPSIPSSSERLQQLGSEAELSYATRVSMIPANHKP